MLFNATFNNISVILVEETRVPGENNRPDKLSPIMLYRVYLAMSVIRTHNLVVIGTDYIEVL
jgi:hypothetical protein